MSNVNAMGKTPAFILTKHARKITVGLALEKTIIQTLPRRQFYDADNFLVTPRGPTLCGPSL